MPRGGRHFARALDLLPAFGQAYIGLADCQVAAGNATAAAATLERGVAANPRDPQLLSGPPSSGVASNDRTRRSRCTNANCLSPRQTRSSRVRLGELYRDAGNPTRAIALLREAVELDPKDASAWNALGMVLGGTGDLSGRRTSVPRSQRAVTRGDAQYAVQPRARTRASGNGSEASSWYQKALERNPAFTAARQRAGGQPAVPMNRRANV